MSRSRQEPHNAGDVPAQPPAVSSAAGRSAEPPPDEPGSGDAPNANGEEGRSKLASAADAAADVASDVASTIVDAAHAGISAAQAGISAARPIMRGVEGFATGARRAFGERAGARVRRVRRMARQPLTNLWDVHPEARRAAIRELGFQTVPVDKIVGTAVEGAPQRGGDFLPLRDRRSDDWRARWQRILRASESLVNLPPVELIRFGDTYWVVDGHNRVAAALYNGQIAIDAVVDDLRLPGMAYDRTPTRIAASLEGSQDLRRAGTGNLNRTLVREQRLPRHIEPHEHGHRHGPPDAPSDAAAAGNEPDE